MLVLNSCTSCPKKTEVIIPKVYIPDVPDPLDAEGNPYISYTEDDDMVHMAKNYWNKIVHYMVYTSAAKAALYEYKYKYKE